MPDVAQDLQGEYTEALRHHLAGRLNEAERGYRQILVVDPHYTDALHTVGVLAHQTGRHGLAVDLIQRAIAQQNDSASFHLNLGSALQARGSLDQAVIAFRRALSQKPDFGEAQYSLACALQAIGKRESAVLSYRRTLMLKPDLAQAHSNIGLALKEAGKLAEAVVAYRCALVCKPDLAELYFNLGVAFSADGRWKWALDALGRAVTCRPAYAEAHGIIGLALSAQGNLVAADDCLKRALSVKPDHADASFNLGVVLVEQGNLLAAANCYQRAVSINPTSVDARVNLGNVLTQIGSFGAAIDQFEHALGIEPDKVQALNGLTDVYLRGDRVAEALDVGCRTLIVKDRLAMARTRLRPTSLAPVTPPDIPIAGKPWVISFSLWGGDPSYTLGAIANASSMRLAFPDWRCRFYCDETVPPDIINALIQEGADVIMKPASDGFRRYAWRFLVASDPHVGRFLCRDCDCRPSVREIAAVSAWIGSGKPFHIIHDHPKHVDLMLAGLWGGVSGVLPDVAMLLDDFPFHTRFCDQRFLGNVIWPLIKNDVLVHDSHYRLFDSRPLPEVLSPDRADHIGGGIKISPRPRGEIERTIGAKPT